MQKWNEMLRKNEKRKNVKQLKWTSNCIQIDMFHKHLKIKFVNLEKILKFGFALGEMPDVEEKEVGESSRQHTLTNRMQEVRMNTLGQFFRMQKILFLNVDAFVPNTSREPSTSRNTSFPCNSSMIYWESIENWTEPWSTLESDFRKLILLGLTNRMITET